MESLSQWIKHLEPLIHRGNVNAFQGLKGQMRRFFFKASDIATSASGLCLCLGFHYISLKAELPHTGTQIYVYSHTRQ